MRKTIRSIKRGLRRIKKADTMAAKLVKWYFIVLVIMNFVVVLKTLFKGF